VLFRSLGAANRRQQLEIVCECANIGCAAPIPISATGYQEARRDPRAFIVKPDHHDPGIETVLARHSGYLLVQKTEEATEESV